MTAKDLALPLLAASLLFLFFLGERDLWNPNEPIYGQAVVEMAERGDWLMPSVNGETFDEKPILYFWLALASAKLTGGVDETSLRLPSALAGLAAMVLVYLLVQPYAGRRRARIAAVLFATTWVVFWSARAVQMDLLLTATTLAAIVAVTRVVDHGLSPYRGFALAGLAAGAGFLCKGPVGLICPGLPLLAYLAWERRLRSLWHPALVVGALCSVAVAAPWYFMLAARGETEFLHELLVRQNFTRFSDPWDHAAPWWYYLYYFWVDMAPWSLFVPLAIALPQRDDAERKLDRLAWIVILTLVGFFSLAASKRSPYILPVAPFAVALVASVASRWSSDALLPSRKRAARAIAGLLGATLVLAGIALQSRGLPRYPELTTVGTVMTVLFVAGGLAVIVSVMLAGKLRLAAPLALLVTITAIYAWAAVAVLPAADRYKSARAFGEQINAHVDAAAPLSSYRFWEWRASYVYYSGRRIPRITSLGELRSYWRHDEQVYLLVERGLIDEARTVLGDAEPLVATPIGSNFVYLFSNR